jgi:hypothetical protein
MATKPVTRSALAPNTTPLTKAQQAARAQGRAPQPTNTVPQPARPQPPAPVPSQEPSEVDLMMAPLPDYMQKYAGAGKENITKEDIETPRLKLIQALSPELQIYNEMRPGNFFHTASEAIIDQEFTAVMVYFDRQYILWRPREMGGGILARAADGIHWSPPEGEFEVILDKKDGGNAVTWRLADTVTRSGLAEWGSMNPGSTPQSPPAATLMYNYVLAFPDMPELMPAVFTFQRSGIKMGRRLNGKLKTSPAPIFGLKYKFIPCEDTNRAGQKFWNVNVVGNGMVSRDEMERYAMLHNNFRVTGLQIKDIETIGDDETATDDPGDGGAAHDAF